MTYLNTKTWLVASCLAGPGHGLRCPGRQRRNGNSETGDGDGDPGDGGPTGDGDEARADAAQQEASDPLPLEPSAPLDNDDPPRNA
ncbi:hypothetical protein [Enhygromyxa salina]|uniref:hypothetical protein n=1 Tax=Enhygromyxa salina TaxID=215803 RepID=UPI0004E765B7|nr:hypothetical protein [Enhygromyxa salina]